MALYKCFIIIIYYWLISECHSERVIKIGQQLPTIHFYGLQ